jgi:hypothetical protein
MAGSFFAVVGLWAGLLIQPYTSVFGAQLNDVPGTLALLRLAGIWETEEILAVVFVRTIRMGQTLNAKSTVLVADHVIVLAVLVRIAIERLVAFVGRIA